MESRQCVRLCLCVLVLTFACTRTQADPSKAKKLTFTASGSSEEWETDTWTITWNEPETFTGSLTYELATRLDAQSWVTHVCDDESVRECVVSGLERFTDYLVRVRATDDTGTSNAFRRLFPPPQSIEWCRLIHVTTDTLTFNWMAVSGLVDGYTYEWRTRDMRTGSWGAWSESIHTGDAVAVLTSLTPSSVYELRVRAYNARHKTPWTVAIASTRESDTKEIHLLSDELPSLDAAGVAVGARVTVLEALVLSNNDTINSLSSDIANLVSRMDTANSYLTQFADSLSTVDNRMSYAESLQLNLSQIVNEQMSFVANLSARAAEDAGVKTSLSTRINSLDRNLTNIAVQMTNTSVRAGVLESERYSLTTVLQSLWGRMGTLETVLDSDRLNVIAAEGQVDDAVSEKYTIEANNNAIGRENEKLFEKFSGFHLGSLALPAQSCLEILQKRPDAPSGTYYLDPLNNTMGAYEVHCDMVTDGGGYTMKRVSGDSSSSVVYYVELCSDFGLQPIVPQSLQHAQSIVNWDEASNILNIVPNYAGAVNLNNWHGVCANDVDCSFWLNNGLVGDLHSHCASANPDGNNDGFPNRLIRAVDGTSCSLFGSFDDNYDTLNAFQGWVHCSTNDKYFSLGGPNQPAQSCLTILEENPDAPSGYYYLDPIGNTLSPFTAYCDMETDGGGYTFVKVNTGTSSTAQSDYVNMCADRGLQLIVPQSYGHAQSIVNWDGQAPNLINIMPITVGASSLVNWKAECSGGANCAYWLNRGQTPSLFSSICRAGFEPNGSTTGLAQRLYRYNFGGSDCSPFGDWDDFQANVDGPTGWTHCSTNDKYFTLGSPNLPGTSCLQILEENPNAPSDIYYINPGNGNVHGTIEVYCDMETDGGGYTYKRLAGIGGSTDTNTYASACADYGMQIIVPQSLAHAQSIVNWDAPSNVANIFPRSDGETTVVNFYGVCAGDVECPFWLNHGLAPSGYISCGSGTDEPNGNNAVSSRLVLSPSLAGDRCSPYNDWDDTTGFLFITDWVHCSTNDKYFSQNCSEVASRYPSAPSGTYTINPIDADPPVNVYCDFDAL